MAIDFPNNPSVNDTFTANNITYVFDGSKWVNESVSFVITSNSIGADELDVAGNGSTSQFLRSDGDGSFSWATPPDTQPNDATITLSAGNGLTGGGDFTTDQSSNETISFDISSNSIGADELDVANNGSAGQALLSDGDGSFSWGAAGADLTDDTSTDSDFYPTLSDSTTGSFTTATVSSSKLKFNPSSGTLEATDFNSLSDKRVKTDIKPLTDSIEKISSLRGVSFRFKESDKESIGVIAQEIESVLPEVVYTGSNGLKSVSYGNIVGLLIEAIKEQQTEIDKLKNKLGE